MQSFIFSNQNSIISDQFKLLSKKISAYARNTASTPTFVSLQGTVNFIGQAHKRPVILFITPGRRSQNSKVMSLTRSRFLWYTAILTLSWIYLIVDSKFGWHWPELVCYPAPYQSLNMRWVYTTLNVSHLLHFLLSKSHPSSDPNDEG